MQVEVSHPLHKADGWGSIVSMQFMCVHNYVCAYLCVHVYVCGMCMCACVCNYVCAYLCVYVYVCGMCVCACVHNYVCMHICVCMCMCVVRMCVCACKGENVREEEWLLLRVCEREKEQKS